MSMRMVRCEWQSYKMYSQKVLIFRAPTGKLIGPMPMERTCMDCGAPLVGRADKKFCDDGCRANHYNRRSSAENGYLRKVNSILKRNRKILGKLNPEQERTVKWQALMDEGFNFNYITD